MIMRFDTSLFRTTPPSESGNSVHFMIMAQSELYALWFGFNGHVSRSCRPSVKICRCQFCSMQMRHLREAFFSLLKEQASCWCTDTSHARTMDNLVQSGEDAVLAWGSSFRWSATDAAKDTILFGNLRQIRTPAAFGTRESIWVRDLSERHRHDGSLCWRNSRTWGFW